MNRKIHHKVRYPFFVLCSLLLCLTCLSGNYANAMQLDPVRPTDTWQSYMTTAPGSGTVDDPYIISSAEEFAFFANQLSVLSMRDVCGEIVNDIDLGAHEWFCKDNDMIGLSLEGNNHTISNVYMNQPKRDNIGLFANPLVRKINNVSLSNVNITGAMSVGAFVGNFSINAALLTNCHVLSGSVSGTSYVAGLVGNYSGKGCTLTGCSNYATITATGSSGVRSAGLAGGINSSAINCMNFGDVICYNGTEVSGLVSAPGAFATGKVENCYVECTIIGKDHIGGITYSGANNTKIKNSGFKGKIICTSDNPTSLGSMIGVKIGVIDPENSFGIAEIFLVNSTNTNCVLPFGFPGDSAVSSYSHCVVTKSDNTKVDLRKYKVGNAETFPFADWSVSEYLNGGYPFPTGIFAVGGFLQNQDIVAYLGSFDFNNRLLLEIKTLANSTYGTDKYVELGKYPQTYVGASMNTTLENWYSGKTVVDTYTVDNGLSATPNVYNAYTYTNGKTYVRVPTPSLNSTSSTYQDGTVVSTSATWFEVEPIRWLILNYADVQNGASPVVVAEKALVANVTWNKAREDQNLWSGTSNIRTWLNGTFYNDTFGSDEKGNIVSTTVLNNSQSSDTDGTGTSTTDDVWLLSKNEVIGKYFTTVAQRLVSPTDFSIANNSLLFIDSSYSTTARPNGGTCVFWLRSAYSNFTNYAQAVNYAGGLSSDISTSIVSAVRPALTLILE